MVSGGSTSARGHLTLTLVDTKGDVQTACGLTPLMAPDTCPTPLGSHHAVESKCLPECS